MNVKFQHYDGDTSKCGKIQSKIKEYGSRNFAAKCLNGFTTAIEQEIQSYELQVRKVTVGGADFWSFEASWRLSEASEITTYDKKISTFGKYPSITHQIS